LIDQLWLFIDGSANNQLKVGCGACLVVNANQAFDISLGEKVQVKTFENTSSTKLELQTLLWALGEQLNADKKVDVYNDFKSEKNKLLNNHLLYREFFRLTDLLNCDFIKVKGHQPSREKDSIDRLFTLVDQAARKALRKMY
jgi:ribonuclease HI